VRLMQKDMQCLAESALFSDASKLANHITLYCSHDEIGYLRAASFTVLEHLEHCSGTI
jgi:hypothetical protein